MEMKENKKNIFKTYHENGQVCVKTNMKKGKYCGDYEDYDDKGNITYKGTMKNDKHVGHYICFQDGEVSERGTFSNDGLEVRVGVRECSIEGKLFNKTIFLNSQGDCIDEFYHQSGEIIAQVKYVKSCPVKVKKGPCWSRVNELSNDVFYDYAIPDESEYPELYRDD